LNCRENRVTYIKGNKLEVGDQCCRLALQMVINIYINKEKSGYRIAFLPPKIRGEKK
jgi:hypothetical protein